MLTELALHRVATAACQLLMLLENIRIHGPSHDGALERDIKHTEEQLFSAIRQLD